MTYEAWRISYQSSEQAARAAYAECDELRSKIEAAESDAAHQKALADSALRVAEGWEEKCNALRADKATLQQMMHSLKDRLEAAEKERDFAKTEIARLHDDIRELTDVRVLDEEDRDLIVAWRQGTATKPAPSVPEDVMRDAERYRYLRARDDGTAGVGCWIEADGRVCDRGWLYGVQLDSAIDSFIEVLAAAPKPEAKP